MKPAHKALVILAKLESKLVLEVPAILALSHLGMAS